MMDDDLGDFFSEIEKVEQVIVKDDVGSSDNSATTATTDTTGTTIEPVTVKTETLIVAAPKVTSAKAVPNITYAASAKPPVSDMFTTSFVIYWHTPVCLCGYNYSCVLVQNVNYWRTLVCLWSM